MLHPFKKEKKEKKNKMDKKWKNFPNVIFALQLSFDMCCTVKSLKVGIFKCTYRENTNTMAIPTYYMALLPTISVSPEKHMHVFIIIMA